MNEPVIRKLWDLPLGTRFRYRGTRQVWVILQRYDDGLVAKWDGVDASSVMQGVYSAAESEEETRSLEVEVVG